VAASRLCRSYAIIFSDDDEVQKRLDAPDAPALFALLGEVNE
jgi:PTS system mannitol-specific IIA component